MKFRILTILFLAAVSCKSPEARYPVTQKSGSYIDESVQRNKELLTQEETYIEQIIEKDSTRDYIASNNGFWYFYNEKNSDSTNTERPEFGDIVVFDYNISTLDGQPIYAEGEKPTREYAVDQEKLFSGLREGLKLMKEGETVTFLFPSYKAFGYYGDKAKIGTNVPITAKVTLHSIKTKTNNESNN
ncbi:gliding motility-associated peptidyl-prolyl isomerase GldI [Zunongwangia sp. F363]|uniref:Peptidyl-prolyl cis-trans isomerase n=1 Tax=Autumnicola tepida TaxID=3075595 RepID=A0ABU3C961_9FLAO|nr:gliding motility-associated peptidyl-prolyl isomerase GldI [Zunongwangia sp. F363]MDT0642874.1 gliding motility-associated peptidyl-prolyl isomerase GldI [Zunongwangia sp. F363]